MAGKKGPTVRKVKLSELLPDPENANRGTERGAQALEKSLRKLGAGRSVLLDRKGRLIAGNKTWETAGSVGFDEVLIIETDGHQLVAVQRNDLDLEEGDAAREMAYQDNRVGDLNLDWDPEQIARDMERMDLSTVGFTAAELNSILEKGQQALEQETPEVEFSEEVLEESQYVVLVFDNELDWKVAQEAFGIRTVAALDHKEGYSRVGVGRVIKGAPVLERLKG